MKKGVSNWVSPALNDSYKLTYIYFFCPAVDRQIPSILSYVQGEEYHGTQAKIQLVRNPENTVAFFRDFIGKE